MKAATPARLTLYQFRPLHDLPNPSPFCMKLETYLRLAGLDYTVARLKNLGQSPTGKAPFMAIDDVVMADSGLIINHLEQRFGHPVDGRLTLAQRAESLALQRLIEEHLYWVGVYAKWVDPQKRAARRGYVQGLLRLSPFMTPIIAPLVERRIKRSLHGHGLGRHPPDVIWQMGIADIQALAHWLGNREWGFLDGPTSFDACLAAFIGNIVRTPWDNPLKAATLKHTSLIAHFERMMARCFPEFK